MGAEETLARARQVAAEYVVARDAAHRALLAEDPETVSLFTRAAEVEAELLRGLLDPPSATELIRPVEHVEPGTWAAMTQGGGTL